ncbi:hypothetical protein GCM10020367_31110 [Streptomyces sannanensis]|uniref:DUF7660 domain-containing protein n=1 Tax=Streptomyces sannanensis TaxID=285536 RepID=A0ABP6SC39_9ACTN
MAQPTYGPAEEVTSRRDLAEHIRQLRSDLLQRSDQWENATLEGCPEAMAAWIEAAPHWYKNRGEAMPEGAEWVYFAQALSAAVVYE